MERNMSKSEIGLLGVGTMGAALALNIADNGFDIAVFNRMVQVTQDLNSPSGDLAARITATEALEDFVASLHPLPHMDK
jgi:6-phosphogluconate dehydrogenase